MTTTPPETPTTTAEMLAHLRNETVFLEAEALVGQMRMEDAQERYRKRRGPLSELVEAQEDHSKAVLALEIHRQEVAALEAQHATEQAQLDRAALLDRMQARTREKVATLTRDVTRQEAAAREWMEATLAARNGAAHVRALDDAQRQDLALLQALDGLPSPAVRQLDPLEKAAFEAALVDWYADPLQRITPQDAVPYVLQEPDHARADHEGRWRGALEEVRRVTAALEAGEPVV